MQRNIPAFRMMTEAKHKDGLKYSMVLAIHESYLYA